MEKVAIVPNYRTRHASSRYRAYNVTEQPGSMFEIYKPGKKYKAIIHQKGIKKELLRISAKHVLDICDVQEYGKEIEQFAAVTVTNRHLQHEFSKRTSRPVFVLPEIVTCPDPPMRLRSGLREMPVVGWFGLWHRDIPPLLSSVTFGCKDILFRVHSHAEAPYKGYWNRELSSRLTCPWEYRAWDWNTICSDLRECDVVIIPTLPTTWWKCKSPNRFVMAVACGVPVLHGGTPSYLDLYDWWWARSNKDFIGLIRQLEERDRREIWEGQVGSIESLLPSRAIETWNRFAETHLL
jgi:hypothetical protein